MNISEKASVSSSLTNLISRLEELLDRRIELEEGWQEISANISTVHDIFNNVIRAFILECRLSLERLDSSPWPFALINELIEHLYRCTFQLRQLHVLLFMHTPPNRLYYYLFFQELIYCFRNIPAAPSGLSCVMIGTGNMAYWHLDEMLIGKTRAFRLLLEPEVRDALDTAITSATAGFECDFQEPLDRQMILAHEMFHAVVRQNPQLRVEFQRIANDPTMQGIFNAVGQSLTVGNIEEFFCDFGAVWFFGPIYAKAFFEEIVFRQKGGTETHPHRILRLQMIFCSWPKKTKYHPYLLELSKYVRGHRDNVTLPPRDMEPMSNEFRRLLSTLGFKRCVSCDDGNAIKEYIENNISYIYAATGGDVRDLLNRLPDRTRLSEKARTNYNEFLLESVRKNAMWRQFFGEKKKLTLRLPSSA